MKRTWNLLAGLLSLVALVVLALGLVWLFGTVKEGTPVGQQVSPIETPTQPRPTPMPGPTARLTPTIPPVPTSLPTPVVTPIPVAAPPFIPGIEDKPPQPYKIVVRMENTLWVVNNDGTDRRMLIDTEKELSLLLGYNPLPEPRIGWGSTSPDGNKLALVLSKQALTKEEAHSLRHHIYLLDIDTGYCSLLVEDGTEPVWSPDGKRIAYQSSNLGLWIVDIATRTTREIFPVEKGYEATGFAWSPNGQKIAFLNKVASLGGTPEMLVVNTDSTGKAVQLIPQAGYYFGGAVWSPDGKRILYGSSAGDYTGPEIPGNLWMMNADGSHQVQLTKDVQIVEASLSPEGAWVAFSGTRYYEEPGYPYDLWLISSNGGRLQRLTQDPVSDHYPYWSPDGTQIIFQRAEQGIWTINLSNGNLKQAYPGKRGVSYYDMAILGRSK